jgi:PAS domain S-box-containing protein
MERQLHILHLEDDPRDAELVRETLAADGLVAEIECVETESEFAAALERSEFDLILADYSLPSFDGLSALTVAQRKRPGIPFMFVSGALGEEIAIESLKSGATDYVLKHKLHRLPPAARRALREVRFRNERKEAIGALQKSEARYRLLFESNPLPMWVFDRQTLRFLAVNEAAISHYGYSREEFLSMTIKDIRAPEEVDRLLQHLSQTHSGFAQSGLWRHRKKDATTIDVEISSHAIEFMEAPAELVLAKDVTEQLRAQEALRAKTVELTTMTQQLWQASRLAMVGELAASIAHELNNPLATISLRLEMLAGQLDGDDQKRRPVEVVADEVDRMGKLVGNLLQFSRRTHQQISTIDLREEIEKSLELIEYHFRSNNILVEREFADGLSPIQADRQQLRQVFLNLLTNAADAMPQGGKVKVSIAPVKDDQGRDLIEVIFVDTGGGIPAQNLDQIWDPFFTTKPEGKGTGLGLAICRRVIEEHDGSIEIKSKIGEGTSVIIQLPVNTQNSSILDDEKPGEVIEVQHV